MADSLTLQQLQQYKLLLVDGKISEFYSVMLAHGYNYAGWAKGVADGDSVAGLSATEFLTGSAMMGVGGLEGRILTQTEIQNIKKGMADAYLNTLIAIADQNGDIVSRDINAQEVWDFHKAVFEDNDLTIENWTLNAPFEIKKTLEGEAALEDFWMVIRDTAGEGLDSFKVNGEIWAIMSILTTAVSNPDIQRLAQSWNTMLNEFEIASSIVSSLWFETEKWFTNDIDRASVLLTATLSHISTNGSDPASTNIVDSLKPITSIALASDIFDKIKSLLLPADDSQTQNNIDSLTINVYGLLTNENVITTFDIKALTSVSQSDLENSIAVRYSILNLMPFALTGNDAIYASHNNNGELDYDNYSESFWTDRIAFFNDQISHDTEGLGAGESLESSEDRFYWDHQAGKMLATGDATIADLGLNAKQYEFGTQTGESLLGDNKEDHLYGLGGDDILYGEEGRDHIEGNADNDTLHGGSENDYLYGGEGNDHLHGDQGVDYLFGGEGDDTYYYQNNSTQFDGNESPVKNILTD